MRLKRIPALFVAMIVTMGCTGCNAQAQAAGQQTPVLVELFTSEGCSSCPPADALLAKLDGTVAPTGQQIIALEEHVTYWNNLGWVDPFSLEFFTQRQNTYSYNTGRDEVYTPQAVINGAEQALGSDRSAVLYAVRATGQPLPLGVKVLSYTPNGASLSVMFSVSGEVPRGGADVFAVLADDADTTSVPRGENAGRTLRHVAVARSVGKGMVLREGDQTLVSIPVSQTLLANAKGGRRLILIVQQHGQGRVIGLSSQEIGSDLSSLKNTTVASRSTGQGRTLETRGSFLWCCKRALYCSSNATAGNVREAR